MPDVISTPTSLSYINPIDLVTYYDQRRVLQLASDTGTPAALTDLSNTSSDAYKFLQACIRTAASDFDSCIQQGGRYSRSVTEGFITYAAANPSDEAGQKRAAIVIQLIADLTFGILASRRGYTADSLKLLAPRYDSALLTLERIAQGFQIFDEPGGIAAGIPSQVKIGQNKYHPSRGNRMFGYFNRYDGEWGYSGGFW